MLHYSNVLWILSCVVFSPNWSFRFMPPKNLPLGWTNYNTYCRVLWGDLGGLGRFMRIKYGSLLSSAWSDQFGPDILVAVIVAVGLLTGFLMSFSRVLFPWSFLGYLTLVAHFLRLFMMVFTLSHGTCNFFGGGVCQFFVPLPWLEPFNSEILYLLCMFFVAHGFSRLMKAGRSDRTSWSEWLHWWFECKRWKKVAMIHLGYNFLHPKKNQNTIWTHGRQTFYIH